MTSVHTISVNEWRNGEIMMNYRWLLRARRWVQNPPSESRIKLVFGVIAVCLILVAVERWVGWPDVLRVDKQPRIR